jgi:hypothetical protein
VLDSPNGSQETVVLILALRTLKPIGDPTWNQKLKRAVRRAILCCRGLLELGKLLPDSTTPLFTSTKKQGVSKVHGR